MSSSLQLICMAEEFEGTKGVSRIGKSKKDRQHMYNGHKIKDKRTNNDLQNIHIKLKTDITSGTRTVKM